jgi:hypothetical protein
MCPEANWPWLGFGAVTELSSVLDNSDTIDDTTCTQLLNDLYAWCGSVNTTGK